MTVTVYGRQTCAPCKTIKQFLTRKQVAFEEVDLDTTPLASELIKNLTGYIQVPTVVVQRGDNTNAVSGLNFGLLTELIA